MVSREWHRRQLQHAPTAAADRYQVFFSAAVFFLHQHPHNYNEHGRRRFTGKATWRYFCSVRHHYGVHLAPHARVRALPCARCHRMGEVEREKGQKSQLSGADKVPYLPHTQTARSAHPAALSTDCARLDHPLHKVLGAQTHRRSRGVGDTNHNHKVCSPLSGGF